MRSDGCWGKGRNQSERAHCPVKQKRREKKQTKSERERVTINQSMDAAVRHYGSIRLLGAAAKGSRSCSRICSSSSWLLLRFSEQPLKKSSEGSGSCSFAALTPIRCLSWSSTTRATTIPLSETQENIAASQIQTDESKTAHVRFVLQKACRFGDKFLIVGDDPIFGLWDPSSAIPLNWSEGHLWNAEFDIPVRKSIQFKFILQKASGEIYWQPGPDRIFQAWETEKTIVLSEDWESAESQKITEEDSSAEAVISLEENAISEPNVAAKLPEEDKILKGFDLKEQINDNEGDSAKLPEEDKIPKGFDLKEQINDNEGDRLLVAALNSVPVSTFADGLLVSDVIKECNSSQLSLQQVETETSERNMISEDIILPAIEKPININSTAPEDRSSRSGMLLEKPTNNNLDATAGCHQEDIILPAIEKLININSTAPEDRSSRSGTLLEKPTNNNLDATAGCHQEDIILPAIEKPININSTAPEDRSSRNSTLLEKPINNNLDATAGCHQEESGCESSVANVLQNDFDWGFKALQKLFFNMGFSTDPSN